MESYNPIVGDTVIIVDSGYNYPNYVTLFKKLG